jgi:hypothetical protein
MGLQVKDVLPFLISYTAVVVVIIIFYWWLAKTIINKVYVKTQSLTKKRLTLALFLLIPTWDILLEFPIYTYLCKTQSGIKIYNLSNHIEGFYAGERQRYNNKDFSLVPYRGAHFIDYKIKNNQDNIYVYYRDSWVDANSTDKCRPINYSIFMTEDIKMYQQGKCIVHNVIKESEVSPYEYYEFQSPKTLRKYDFLHIHINSIASIIDKKNQKVLAEVVEVSWNGGWVLNLLNLCPVESDWRFRCPNFDEKIKIDDIFIREVVNSK